MACLVVLTIFPLTFLILRDGRAVDALQQEQTAKALMQATQTSILNKRLADQADRLRRQSAERERAEAALFRSQKMEAVGQLTGGIAHDFNNLLMAISGNLQLLLKRMPEDHAARRFAENAAAASDRGARLTAQLLAFSRTQKMNMQPVELDPILNKATGLLANAAGPSVTIEVDLNAPGAWVATDADQLDLAILNLALNARDAMPLGGRLILHSTVQLHQATEGRAETPHLVISIKDTGEGMTSEVASRAFEPFFYNPRSGGKGAGLGLAQVYGFARQSRGDVKIISEVGRGNDRSTVIAVC